MAFFYLPILVYAAFMSSKQGFSQYYTRSAINNQDISKLDKAISFDETNPEAHRFKGLFHLQNNDLPSSAQDLKKAVDLKPNDYLLWLQLGFTNNKLKEYDKAKIAYERSVILAPNYYQPRQYLGFLHLRQNNPQEAFTHLNKASIINPALLPQVLQLAHYIFSENPLEIEKAVQPHSNAAKKIMAEFFLNKNLISDKTVEFLTGSELEEKSKKEFISQLIKAKNYKLAFSIWESIPKNKVSLQNFDKNKILDGDFENTISTDNVGYGWQFENDSNIEMRLDNKKPFTGSASLLIHFNGKSNTNQPILSQLIAAKPNQSYSLTFAARTEDIVTGGLPVISVVDADSGNMINQSAALTSSNSQWQQFKVDFRTENQTQAFKIRLLRQNCKENPCPIFGKLWLDEINLREF